MMKRANRQANMSTGIHDELPRSSSAPSMRAANTSHNGKHCTAGFTSAIPLTPNRVAVDEPVLRCANVRRRFACIVDSPSCPKRTKRENGAYARIASKWEGCHEMPNGPERQTDG